MSAPSPYQVALSLREANERIAELERQLATAEAEGMREALMRCRTVLGNMALENEGSIFNRWPISHEPLRSDARNLLPMIDAALAPRGSKMSELELTMVPRELYYHEVAYVRGLESTIVALTKERDEARDEAQTVLAECDHRDAEIADLKRSVITFLAPWAVRYAKDFGLDGLRPVHYDLLAKCGARMVDFKRAALASPQQGKGE